MLPKLLFAITAALYAFCSIGRIYSLWRKNEPVIQRFARLEKFAFLCFTAALVAYLYLINQGQQEKMIEIIGYKKPLSWLLFAWCLNAATILAEIAYGSQISAVFSSAWTVFALSLLPNTSAKRIASVFSNNLDWVHLHRLGFLLGYAFCLLAFPVTLQFLWYHLRRDSLRDLDPIAWDRRQNRRDRMQYRFVLWALPLLTVGILVEGMYMLDNGTFPTPTEIWRERKEEFLALFTWFVCGLYLHARIFFGWRYRRAAWLFCAGLILVLVGHISIDFLHFPASH